MFEKFGKYIQNYDRASTLFDKLMKKKKFEDFCDKAKEQPQSNNADLLSFLINPVQRIPRYILLMREYVKSTDKDHPDVIIAQQVMRYLDSYTKKVNENIARENTKIEIKEICKRIDNLDSSVKDELLKQCIGLKREGALMKQCRKTIKERYFFLFKDASIIYGLREGKRILFHQRLILTSAGNPRDKNNENSNLGILLKAPNKSVVVYASNEDERKDWVRDLNEIFIGESKEIFNDDDEDIKDGAAPVWIPDNEQLTCMECGVKFTVFNRRHHCRSCGRVLCGNCTKFNAIIKQISPKPQRVCKNCYEKFSKQENSCNESNQSETNESNFRSDESIDSSEITVSEQSQQQQQQQLHTSVLAQSYLKRSNRLKCYEDLPLPERDPPALPE